MYSIVGLDMRITEQYRSMYEKSTTVFYMLRLCVYVVYDSVALEFPEIWRV
jgi:hypothetical protein